MVSWNVALIGECMVELQEAADTGCTIRFGGDTLNTAVYLARLGNHMGIRAEYVTALGTDSLSDRMTAFWEAEGVRSSLVRRIPGKLPGLYYISLSADGERTFSYWRGESAAKDCFQPPEGEALVAALKNFDCIYLSGISLAILRPEGREVLLHGLEKLSRSGKQVVFDGNYRPRLWSSDPDTALEVACPVYRRVIDLADIVLLTTDELPVAGMADGGEVELREVFSAQHPSEIIVKDGGNDCLVWHKRRLHAVPPRTLDAVRDTTAAGDSFSAAYLLARHLGHEPVVAVRAAHTLAASVVSHYGAVIAREHMPDIFTTSKL